MFALSGTSLRRENWGAQWYKFKWHDLGEILYKNVSKTPCAQRLKTVHPKHIAKSVHMMPCDGITFAGRWERQDVRTLQNFNLVGSFAGDFDHFHAVILSYCSDLKAVTSRNNIIQGFSKQRCQVSCYSPSCTLMILGRTSHVIKCYKGGWLRYCIFSVSPLVFWQGLPPDFSSPRSTRFELSSFYLMLISKEKLSEFWDKGLQAGGSHANRLYRV